MIKHRVFFARRLVALSVLGAALLPGIAEAADERQCQARYGGVYQLPMQGRKE